MFERRSISLKPLSQQVVVITGADSGIGLVTAHTAARRGARVLLIARDDAALRRAVHAIGAAGGVAAHAVADVADAAALDAAAEVAIGLWGRIDTWVNVAGVSIVARLLDTPLAEHQRIFQTNYFGVVNGATTAVRHLRHQGGALVTVASIAADLPTPRMGAYAATKHAVQGYVQTLRLELLADNLPISVTLVKPSGIATALAGHEANHTGGEPVLPPPLYDPQLVADAILHAAEHPRRAITVGGAGRLQVLLGTHFPWLLDRFAGVLTAMPSDPTRPDTARSTLFVPAGQHRARSPSERGRTTSLYTSAVLHPMAAAGAALAVAGVVALSLSARRSARSSEVSSTRKPASPSISGRGRRR